MSNQKKKLKKRGGARKGAGRPKSSTKKMINFRLEWEEIEWLKKQKSKTGAIRKLIAKERTEVLYALAEVLVLFFITNEMTQNYKQFVTQNIHDFDLLTEPFSISSINVTLRSDKFGYGCLIKQLNYQTNTSFDGNKIYAIPLDQSILLDIASLHHFYDRAFFDYGSHDFSIELANVIINRLDQYTEMNRK